MSRADAWQGMRKLVAERDGYRCHYCGVPTAATIEHIQPRSDGGAHEHRNLRIACPWCNTTRRDAPYQAWVERAAWREGIPDQLEPTVREMCTARFQAPSASGLVTTGSTNARLRIRDGIVTAEVRAGNQDPWRIIRFGREHHPRVVEAAWLFLRQHHTRSA